MEKKICTLGEMLNLGMVGKGDFFGYKPDIGKYITDIAKTGFWTTEYLRTYKNTTWRVNHINKRTNFVKLRTTRPLNGLTLYGARGYFNGIDVINEANAKLYSNESLGIIAQNLTMEDVDLEIGYEVETPERRYAYYPFGSNVKGYVLHNGKAYKKVVHATKEVKFYESDGGGIEYKDKNGICYRVPAISNPVFVTGNFYWYETKLFSEYPPKNFAWLASRSVNAYENFVNYDMRIVAPDYTLGYYMCTSNGYEYYGKYGLFPSVNLYSDILIDLSDERYNGSTPARAWKIVGC